MRAATDVIGSKGSHDAIRRALAAHAPCKVLDIPAGHGPLSLYMRELGWEVHCSDIDPGNFLAEGFPFTAANLNRPLPFADASFDAVVCANAAHRIFNAGGAMMEFFRVLRPGGTLFVNVNNYSSIRRRLRFLVYGSIDNAVNQAHCRQTTDNPEAHVRIAVVYPHLGSALEHAGFRIESIRAADVRFMHRALAPAAWLVRLAALLIGPSSRRKNRVREANGPGLLPGGNYVLITARKPG